MAQAIANWACRQHVVHYCCTRHVMLHSTVALTLFVQSRGERGRLCAPRAQIKPSPGSPRSPLRAARATKSSPGSPRSSLYAARAQKSVSGWARSSLYAPDVFEIAALGSPAHSLVPIAAKSSQNDGTFTAKVKQCPLGGLASAGGFATKLGVDLQKGENTKRRHRYRMLVLAPAGYACVKRRRLL